jgi:hypothetical protein
MALRTRPDCKARACAWNDASLLSPTRSPRHASAPAGLPPARARAAGPRPPAWKSGTSECGSGGQPPVLPTREGACRQLPATMRRLGGGRVLVVLPGPRVQRCLTSCCSRAPSLRSVSVRRQSLLRASLLSTLGRRMGLRMRREPRGSGWPQGPVLWTPSRPAAASARSANRFQA